VKSRKVLGGSSKVLNGSCKVLTRFCNVLVGVAAVVLTVVVLRGEAAVGATPAVIENFLRANADYRLLRLEDVRDIVEPAGIDRFSPFVDIAGDGQHDVAAVIVAAGSSPARYGVVAFHTDNAGRPSDAVHWIVRSQAERIAGVYAGERRRLVVAYCLDCDSNPFVRWAGSDYEFYLWLPGETAKAYDEISDEEPDEEAPVILRTAPAVDSPSAAEVPLCTEVKIIKSVRGSTDGKRWYNVEVLVKDRRVSGFLPASALTAVSCAG